MKTFVLTSVAFFALAASSPGAAADWRSEHAVSDAVLASVSGRATPTTRLSVIVDNVGALQAQRVGEDLRVTFSNWFADNNVQSIANTYMASAQQIAW